MYTTRLTPAIAGLILLLTIPALPQAQELEGTVRYVATHNWVKQMAQLDYISQQQKERMSYMWANDSEWKTYTVLHLTPAKSLYQDSEEKMSADDEGYAWRKSVFHIQRDFANNRLHDILKIEGKTYHIEDTLQAPQWKVLNDIKEVAGHICMNAVWEDTIKRQTVVAWFALDIPSNAGPERFYGLPGLILEVEVNDGALVISADKIEPKKLGAELDLPKKIKGKKVTEAEYRRLLIDYMQEKRRMEQPWNWGLRY